jgi:hypothetical protein
MALLSHGSEAELLHRFQFGEAVQRLSVPRT